MPALSALRRRRMLTQRALAEKAGVALSTVYGLEAGHRPRPRFGVMQQIAVALGVDPAEVDEFRPALGLDSERKRVAA